MLSTVLIVFIGSWVAGMATSSTIDRFFHVLLIITVAAVLSRPIQGHQPFAG